MTEVDHAAASKAALEADKKRQDEARKKVKEDREAREKSGKEVKEAGAVKPTPTQEENDLAAMGVHGELEADGSPEEPAAGATKDSKDSKPVAAPKGGYSTRSAG
jgi:hypothetical protein